MAMAARARIEALLRERKLDTTLTPAHPPDAAADDQYVVPTGIGALDAHLGGGLARGQMSEIVGPRSSGRTSVLLSAMAGATARGELVALVDPFDTLDPQSAHAGGLDLSRLLWVRGGDLERALKALNLVLQAGGFGLVALDLADVQPVLIKRLPFTTWLRLQRPIEGSTTACVVVGREPVARSAGGVTISLHRQSSPRLAGVSANEPPAELRGADVSWARLFPGLDVEARLARARGLGGTCHFHLAAR